MKELIINLGTKTNKIQIVPLGDLHVGDEFCDLDGIKAVINSYRETLTMEQEQELLIELLTPIKDKILMMTQGNHEYRTNLLVGIDPLRYVARCLGLVEKGRYTDNSYLLTLQFGKRNGTDKCTNTYTIFGTHGVGGGRRIGSSANVLEDMSHIIPNADLYIHSHTHNIVNFTDCVFIYNTNNKKLEKHKRTFVNTNSFVDYGGYAERKCYKPSDTTPSTVVIEMVRNRGDMIKKTDILRI